MGPEGTILNRDVFRRVLVVKFPAEFFYIGDKTGNLNIIINLRWDPSRSWRCRRTSRSAKAFCNKSRSESVRRQGQSGEHAAPYFSKNGGG